MQQLAFHPLGPENLADVDALFGPSGACAGCWCMYWRLTRAVFERDKGEGNRRALHELVRGGVSPGLIAYRNGEPCGWCAFGPREEYVRLERSRVLRRVDDTRVWSIVCFFVARRHRRSGVSLALLRKAVEHVRSLGGTVVEGYPVEADRRYPDAFAYTGLASTFRRAGFREVARRSPNRPIMRKFLRPPKR